MGFQIPNAQANRSTNGWRCPSCNGGNAPDVSRCPCTPMPRALVAPEVLASRWDLKGSTIRRWIREGRLPAVRIGTNRTAILRIDVAVVEAWLESRQPQSLSYKEEE